MYSNKDYESTADTNTSYNNVNKDVIYKSTQFKQRKSIWSLFGKRFIVYIIYNNLL